jgi:hypothetical protein
MLAFDAARLQSGRSEASEIDTLVRRSAEFHVEYLLAAAPEQIAAETPHLAGHWARIRGTGAGHHTAVRTRGTGRRRGTASRGLVGAGRAGALVVYGEYDQFEPPPAHRAIAEAVERTHPGRARVVEVPRMNHFYRVFADPRAAAEDEPGQDAAELAAGPTLAWLEEVLRTN